MTSTVAERIAMRSRVVTIAGLVVLMLLAWAFLLSGTALPAMAGMAAFPGFVAVVIMWWVMMVAMMVPAAAPTILLYAHVHRHSNRLRSAPSTAAFLGGYLACWLVFALIAAGLQSWLVSPMSMALAIRDAAGGLLIAAGLYQLTPFKNACLSRCRSPALFLSRHYRPGPLGAFRLGMLHGANCIGCCWLLMTLLFVGGVMNLVWVVGLTLLVVAEKLLPGGLWLARIAGIALIAWGGARIVG
jgi:predicted metal-binding membrane protein